MTAKAPGLVRETDVPTTGKTNERPGTRAVAKHIRMSAYKARVVLDLIRHKDVQTADEILRFSEREAATVIRKVLRSAVANAEHNDEQIPDDLYVAACFADEGKTLRRMRPRARGRATRIRKRTCHITVIVSRMPEREIERRREAEAQRPGSRAARRAGQEAAEQQRRRRRRRGGAEAEVHDHEQHAEEAEIVDQQAAAVDQVDAIEEGAETPEPAEAIESEAEEAGVVDQQAPAAEAADDAAEPATDTDTVAEAAEEAGAVDQQAEAAEQAEPGAGAVGDNTEEDEK
jgi:large subunit ribosomal protein L22